MKPYSFAVTEVFDDGCVLVFIYVHYLTRITAILDVYTDQTLQHYQRYLNLQLDQSQPIGLPSV